MSDVPAGANRYPTPLILLVLLLALGGVAYVFFRLSPESRRRRLWEQTMPPWGLEDVVLAEGAYRRDDPDGNQIQDYWTGDVAGLLKYGRIDRATAEADAHPLVPLVPVPVPKNGFLFVALDADETQTPPDPYRQETDSKSGKVHHPTKFGFLAYPVDPTTHPSMFIVNESGRYLHAPSERPLPKNYPSPADLASWGR